MENQKRASVGLQTIVDCYARLEEAGFTELDFHCVCNSRGDVGPLAMLEALRKSVQSNELWFKKHWTRTLSVPDDFDPDECVNSLQHVQAKKGRRILNVNHDIFSDQNLSRVTEKPCPSEQYDVTLFEIRQPSPLSLEECLRQSTSEGGVLLGGQGLILAFDAFAEELPHEQHDVRLFSFDEKEALGDDGGGDLVIPFVDLYKKEGEGQQIFGFNGLPIEEVENIKFGESFLLRFVPCF